MIKTDNGHFYLTFENGYTISVYNGYGSYSENYLKDDLLKILKYDQIKSKDCEIAILNNGLFTTNKFIECDDCVKGFISADELADIIYKVKNFKGDNND